MGQPKIEVKLTNGGIGGNPPNEWGVSALAVTGVTLAGLALNEPKLIYSLQEAIDLGITSTATPYAYRQIKGFYDAYNFITGSEIAPLFIMMTADTQTLEETADKDEPNGLIKVLNFANGKVRLAAIGRKPDGAYVPDVTNGVEADSIAAVANGQLLCNTLFAAHNPLRMFVEQRGFLIANVASLEDYETHEENRVRPTLGSGLADGTADVGIELGLAAGLPLRRNIGRVKNGALLFLSNAYVGDTAIEDLTAADTIYDKGYGFFRTYPNKNGYFVNDDRMATSKADDYGYLYRGRCIDEVHRILYRVYVEYINDDFEAIEGGKIDPGVIATMTKEMKDAVKVELSTELSKQDDGSFIKVTIDPEQNVVTAGKTKIKFRVRAKGHFKDFEAELGFEL